MKLLLVDDDIDCLNDIADALDLYGFDCEKENDSLNAMDRIKNTRFDAVITDVRMPGGV